MDLNTNNLENVSNIHGTKSLKTAHHICSSNGRPRVQRPDVARRICRDEHQRWASKSRTWEPFVHIAKMYRTIRHSISYVEPIYYNIMFHGSTEHVAAPVCVEARFGGAPAASWKPQQERSNAGLDTRVSEVRDTLLGSSFYGNPTISGVYDIGVP